MDAMAPKTELNKPSIALDAAHAESFDAQAKVGHRDAQGHQERSKRAQAIMTQNGRKNRPQRSSKAIIGVPLAQVDRLPVTSTLKAFELLAQQPVSLIGLALAQRNAVVVTAVADDAGNEHVLSRFGDAVWDLSPEMPAKNRSAKTKRIRWPSNVAQALVDDAKAAVYCALRQGRYDMNWSASSACNVGQRVEVTLRHLASLGIENFSQVRSLYVTDYIAELKKSIGLTTICSRLFILDLVWSFEQEMIHPLPEHPFAGKALWEAVGGHNQGGPIGKTGTTPVIPPSVQKPLWEYCESILAGSEAVFEARDSSEIMPDSGSLIAIRDAVLYQLTITSGMRNSEATGVTNGCWRVEQQTLRDGRKVLFHWVRTKEIKTSGGKEMDYLVPGELFPSLEILQRNAEPLQQRLADEAKWLESILASGTDSTGRLSNGTAVADAVQRLNHVREIGHHMLLGISHNASDHLGRGSRVEVSSSGACGNALNRLTKAAGVKWKIANHQCRRTFAWNVANSRLGRMGLVFIKWQFKHASISWTQLYAANPRQDQALYQEFGNAMWETKVELIEAWQKADMQLSGGAGKKLMQTRATPVRDFKQLLAATADSVDLRSTGHAWCMSGTHKCHGQGVYDPTMCGGCSQAIIDESQASRWQMIHLDNLRLAAITDCGPAVEAKAKRAVEMSTQVLADLGVALPTAEQTKSYEEGVWVE